MDWIVQAILTGTTAFVATNIDDIVILMLFFAQINASFRPHHIVLGQYLGFAVLILASLPGFFGGLFLAPEWIGLLGFLPIVIGLKQWWSQEESTEAVQTVSWTALHQGNPRSPLSWLATLLTPQTYSVAAITIANGGDNIGIYLPLFASTHLAMLLVILAVFLVLIALWCGMAYQLARFPAIARVLKHYNHVLVPLVLIGLGLFILIENKSYRLLNWRS